jgi:hypothetical protein
MIHSLVWSPLVDRRAYFSAWKLASLTVITPPVDANSPGGRCHRITPLPPQETGIQGTWMIPLIPLSAAFLRVRILY